MVVRYRRRELVTALVSLLALAALPTGSALITEQQLGAVDWYRQYLGRVTHAVFAPANRPRVYVASEAGALAALNLRNGSVVWRQVLAEGDAVDYLWHLPPPATSALLTLSGGGKALRAWSAADGALLWERLLISGSGGGGQAPVRAILLDSGVVVTAIAGTVQALSVSEDAAKPLWSLDVPSLENSVATDLAAAGPVSLLFAGIAAGGGSITTAKIAWSEADGAEIRTATDLESSVPLTGPLRIVGTTIAATAADGTALYIIPAAGGHTMSTVRLVRRPRSIESHSGITAVLAVGYEDKMIAYVDKTGQLQPVGMYEGATAGTNILSSNNEEVAGVVGIDGHKVRLRVLSLAHGEELYDDSFDVTQQTAHGGAAAPVTAAFMDSYRRKDDSKGYRVLVVLEDGTLALGQQGQAVWTRPDGLASMRATMFMDLPSSQELSEERRDTITAFDALQNRLRFEFLNVKAGLQQASSEEQAFRAAYRSQHSARLSPARDSDGFRKLLLVLTDGGLLAGLHNGDGHVMWSHYYGSNGAPTILLPWRSSHDAQHAPEVAAVRLKATATYVSTVNVHTGRETSSFSVPFGALQVVPVPLTLRDGSAEQSVYLLAGAAGGSDDSPTLQLLPDTPTAQAAFAAMDHDMYFWTHNPATGSLQGFGVDRQLRAVLRWTAVCAEGDAWLAIAGRDTQEPVQAAVKVLGDKSMQIKYLNPNVLFAAAGLPDGQPVLPGAPSPQLRIELLDTVTGRVLASFVHKGARGPVHAVLSENWAVYHYWSITNRRFEVAVAELYDIGPRNFKPKDLLFGSVVEVATSYEPAALEISHDKFFWTAPVAAMAVTSTAKGIAPKFLLLGTAAGQIYMMDKRLVDPRRPRTDKPTEAERQEGLMRYSPQLQQIASLFASYNRQIPRLRGIVTAAAVLESTSHVFAYGMDHFYTRVQPAATFDLLAEDFPYALLVLLVAGMIIGSMALRIMSSRAVIKDKWQ